MFGRAGHINHAPRQETYEDRDPDDVTDREMRQRENKRGDKGRGVEREREENTR